MMARADLSLAAKFITACSGIRTYVAVVNKEGRIGFVVPNRRSFASLEDQITQIIGRPDFETHHNGYHTCEWFFDDSRSIQLRKIRNEVGTQIHLVDSQLATGRMLLVGEL